MAGMTRTPAHAPALAFAPHLRRLALALPVGLACLATVVPAHAANLCAGLPSYTVNPLIGGNPMDLCKLPARALLVVNTASECGFTPQYGSLEKLHQRYQAKGLQVVGIPANDFGGQEPRKNAAIGSFCQVNYGVTFPVAEKLTVPIKTDPLFARLIATSKESPSWNFHKYLITPDGKVTSFPSMLDPLNPRLVQAVEAALAVK
jgi:glutathione peroxidase